MHRWACAHNLRPGDGLAQELQPEGLDVVNFAEIDYDLDIGGEGAGPADQRVQSPLAVLGEAPSDGNPDVPSIEIDVDNDGNLVVHDGSFRCAEKVS